MSTRQHPRSGRLRAFALALPLLLLTLVLAACGGDDEQQAASSDPASVVPAGAAAYGEVLVRPSGDVEEGVVTAARRVSQLEDPFGEIARALDEEMTDDGETGQWSREIDPWLGDTVGGFLLIEDGTALESPDGGFLASVRDRDAAQEMLDDTRADGDSRRGGEIDGVPYDVDVSDDSVAALVEDFLFIGTLPALRATVAASRGESLADSARFADSAEELDDDRVAWGWFDPQPLLPLIAEQPDLDPSLRRLIDSQEARDAEPATMSVAVRADEIVVEVAADGDWARPEESDGGEVAIADLPGEAWLALATPPFGDQITRSLRESGEYDMVADQLRRFTGLDLDRDVLGWLGGVSAFVSGSAPLDIGGGVVIGSSDEAASTRFVTRLQRLAESIGIPTQPLSAGAGTDGFSVQFPDVPQRIGIATRGDKVAIGLAGSIGEAMDPDETFADSEAGKAALASLGEGFEPSIVFVVDPMLRLFRALGAETDPEAASFAPGLPYLTAYRSIAIGTKYGEDRTEFRFVAALQEPTDRP